jgi:NAD-dependent dihydropyrimidine dehydrogenase PreA subunit
MAHVIAEPCVGVKDSACVDARPVDCIHPKKNTTYEDGRPDFDKVSQLYIDPIECIDCGLRARLSGVSDFRVGRPPREVEVCGTDDSYVKGGKFTPDEFAKHQVAK